MMNNTMLQNLGTFGYSVTQASRVHTQAVGDSMTQKAINFLQKFALFDEQWAPKVIAEMND
jgi:hypothetical protein